MNCRECGRNSCSCILVPASRLHLESPSWESITLYISPTLTKESLHAKIDHFLPAVFEAMDEFFSAGTTTKLAQLLQERRECVIGLKAALPVAYVIVFADAEAAMKHATTAGEGDWCVALPLGPLPNLVEQNLRCLMKNRGISVISRESSYNVVSHNWPRPVRLSLSHASVLGISWQIWDSALRQIESALALAELFEEPIWIDYLCIDQENPDEKRVLLPQMGRIYENSRYGFIDCTMTPSVASINPKHVEELISIESSSGKNNSDEERRKRLRQVIESPWFSRCWTFQEELLTPKLRVYDPSQDKIVCDFFTLQEKCIQEFHHLHASMGHDIAKSEGWFYKAAAIMNHNELMQQKPPWNLGSILAIRGRRNSLEECDQFNSLLGILDVKCNQKNISILTTLNEKTFVTFLQECSENGDTSWVMGEDPTVLTPHLSWAPSSPYVEFSTQAEASSIKWLSMTKAGPELLFYRAIDVVEVIPLLQRTDFRTTFSRLRDYGVDGEWLLEYCGIAFGSDMKDPLPIPTAACQELFTNHYGCWDSFEERLINYLPKQAQWRAKELRNYLGGCSGRFNAWIVCQTPVRKIALMAKVLTRLEPKEVLFGFPAESKYRKTHSFFPVMIVDDSLVRRRVGWCWPCIHATLKGEEAMSEECVRCISN